MKHSFSGRILCSIFLLVVFCVPSWTQQTEKRTTQNLKLKTQKKPAAVDSAISADRAAALAATEEIFKEVSLLRELEIKQKVKSGFRTRAELEKDVLSDLNESTTVGEFSAQTKMLVKLGLVPAKYNLHDEMVKILTEQISGFYKPKTGEFFLTDTADLDEQKIVMAHELTHALQDQHFNLRRFEKFPKGQSDQETAIHALIEGDATVVMFDYFLKPYGKTVAELPISLSDAMGMLSGAGMSKDKTPAFSSAPHCIQESLTFPYFAGAGFVQSVVKQGGWARVSKAYTFLPESTEQILHPEKYFQAEHPTWITIAPVEKLLGKDWKVVMGDTNGEFGYRLILGEYLEREMAERGAAGWGGDTCRLFENSALQQLLLVQHTIWDDDAEAQEFADLYAKRTEKRYPKCKLSPTADAVQGRTSEGWVSIERHGREVLILEGVSEAKDLSRLSGFLWKEDRKQTTGDKETGRQGDREIRK